MKTKRNLIGFTLFILLFALLTVTGCNQEKESATGYIGISVEDGGQSRGINGDNEAWYADAEKLYWTYTAVKIGTGDKQGETRGKQHIVGKVSGNLQDRTGLDGKPIGPLAVGQWKIELFGYLEDTNPESDSGNARNVNDGRDNTLVYVGKRVEHYTIISSTADWADAYEKNKLTFNLESPESLKGYLEFGGQLTLTVPEGQSFHGGKGTLYNADTVNNIKVRFIDVTDSANPVVIAESKTNLSEDASRVYEPGEEILLNEPVFLDTTKVKTVMKDSVEHKYYPFDTTGTRNFVVVLEYMDGYSTGNNDYDHLARYQDGEKGSFYEQDYAPVGDIISFPLKFTGGVSVTLSGDVNDLKANGGDIKDLTFEVANYAVVYWTEDTSTGSGYYKRDENKPPKYFSSLDDAVQTWITDNGNQTTNLPKHRITVLRDMNTVGNVETRAVDVPVYPDGHFLDNLTIDGGDEAKGSIVFCVCDAESGQENNYNRISRYKVSPYMDGDTPVKPVVKNINSKVGTSSDGTKVVSTNIFLDKGDCTFEARDNHTINLSGIARKVSVGKTEDETGYKPTLKLGTRTDCQIEELSVKGGKVELGGWTKVTNLAVDTRVASDSTLKGTTSAYVGNLDTEIRTGSILGSDLQKAVFKKVVLHGNNATSNPMTLYGIEGMYLSLLDFNTFSPAWTKTDADGTELVFMNWNTASNVSGSTVSNAARVLMGNSDMELYAVWAQSLGGRVFYVNDDEGLTNYHFYGAEHNELLYWRGALDKARELSAAAYVLNTSDTVKDKVYIAYTLTDPTTGVSAEIGLYEPTVYKWHTDYGTSASVPFETDDIGKGKEHTNAVFEGSVVPDFDDGSLFRGIKTLRTTDAGRGHKDWFIGSKTEYTKLYESGVPRPERITSLTENDAHDKVSEFCGDMYTPTWSEKDFGDEGKIAFLLPLRSV